MGIHLGNCLLRDVDSVQTLEKTKRLHSNNVTRFPDVQDVICNRSFDADDCLLSSLYILE